MRGLFLSITALLAGTSLVQLGGGLIGTLIAMQMAMRSFPVSTAGLIMSAFSIGYVVSVFYAHTLIERVGHIRAYAVFATVLSAVTLIYPFAVSPLSWGALRITQGFCFAGLSVCSESWLNERSTNEVRGQVFSFYMIAIYVAQAMGQFLLMVPDSSGYGLFVIASILLSLALVPVAMTHVPAPPTPQPSRINLRRLFAASPLGAFGALLSGVVVGAFNGMAPYLARDIELTATGTAQLMSAAIFGGLIMQWPIGKLSDRVDRRLVIIAITVAILVTGVAGAILVRLQPSALILLAPLLGGALFTLYPLCVAHTNDFLAPQDMVAMSGGLILAYGIGAILGPFCAASLMDPLGPEGLFIFIAGCGGGGRRLRDPASARPRRPDGRRQGILPGGFGHDDDDLARAGSARRPRCGVLRDRNPAAGRRFRAGRRERGERGEIMERATGFEPATPSLGSSCSTN